MLVKLMERKNIGEDGGSFSVRDLRTVFACFQLSFLLFNFMIRRTKRTKLEKLMIFEIFPPIVSLMLAKLILVTIALSNRDPKRARN